MSITISSTLADKLALTGHTSSCQQVESFLADQTTVLLPIETVLELANPLHKLVVFLAAYTHMVLVFQASVNHADASSQFEVRHALRTYSSVVLRTSIFVFFA